ncbi:uncharacterized protein N7458_012510 [Penicillium daleae]|uniref:Uncharacterized protein n=1 Tax=Penicillium daleae TaxID=63821 RepID=A0AAD6BV35_9EURO|nr:uncharacterized protein N7458_012510 [Penicillium daleae]KAJ5433354.1 hypothetical protein N7458_012510 [Penicillium daleae]
MDSGFGRDTFCNVIADPCASECISDVRLIQQTMESINVAATSHPELGTPDEIYFVTEFIAQLNRLGMAAIKRHATIS